MQSAVINNNIQGIISDNRYGLYHSVIPNVIMTHQLNVQTGLGKLPNKIIQNIHYKYLDKFNKVWIVDVEGNNNLSGNLSHNTRLPKSSEFIGLLSQFEGINTVVSNHLKLLILLSGAEPQRTILSHILWQQVLDYNHEVTFVEGRENSLRALENIPNHIKYYDRLTYKDLLHLIQASDIVLCRSGYTTIMDLTLLNKKAILIPTPEQTEQEYLAMYMKKQGLFYSVPQKNFSLDTALKNSLNFPFHSKFNTEDFTQFAYVLQKWLNLI